MNRRQSNTVLRCVLLTASVLAASGWVAAALRADDAAKEKDLQARLIGTWKLVSAKYGDQESALPHSMTTLKHITPGGFVWLSFDPTSKKVERAAGGSYTLKGDQYAEKPSYGMGDDFAQVRDAEHTFTCKIDGDRWSHTGSLADGTTIDEVWERVKPAAPKAP